MRKTFFRFFILSLAFALFICTVPEVFAEDRIDPDSAKTLIKNARDIMLSYEVGFRWFIDVKDTSGSDDRSQDVAVLGYGGHDYASYFRPVKDGFDADGVKQLISDTFASQVAEYYLAKESFYDLYYTKDNRLYYYISYGSQLGDFSSFDLTDGEIDALEILDTGDASVKTTYRRPYYGDFDREAIVLFSFVKENGEWKVSGIDTSGGVFSLYVKEIDRTAFSEELAKTEIVALIGDIYSLTYVDGGSFAYHMDINDLNSGEPGSVKREGVDYYRIRGAKGKTETWMNYALRFATSEIAERLVKNGSYCIDVDGRMYYSGRNSSNNAFAVLNFSPEALAGAAYSTVSQNENGAAVKVTLTTREHETVDLSFEFSPVSGQWVVSGGDFAEKLDALFGTKTANANTGDDAQILLLAGFIVIIVSITVVKAKSKRKSD